MPEPVGEITTVIYQSLADRMEPRMRYKESIDEILSESYDPKMVKPCVESKVFGIGFGAFGTVNVPAS